MINVAEGLDSKLHDLLKLEQELNVDQ